MSDNNSFAFLPLQKLLNRENPISRIEVLERKTGARPSAIIGTLSSIGQNTGDLVVDGSVIVPNRTDGLPDVTLDDNGLTIRNQEGAIYFVDTSGNLFKLSISSGATDDIEYTNDVPGAGHLFFATLTGGASTYFSFKEPAGVPGVAQLNVTPEAAGSLISIGGELVLWGGVDGKTNQFNAGGYDINHIFYDDAGAQALNVDAGAHTVSVYGTAVHPPAVETNTSLIYGVSASPGGASTFAGTIASKAGATVTYNVTSGTEGAMKPSATTHLAKMRLYNTTRGDYALISDVNTATNVITLTATVPAAWAATDVITIASQTVSGDGLGWCDLELTSGPTGKTALFVQLIIISATVGDAARITPFDGSYSSSKSIATFAQAVSINSTMFGLYPLNSDTLTISWTGTPTNVLIRESGYLA